MDTLHKLIIRGPDGVKRCEVGDYEELSYTRRVNAPGMVRFRLRGDHPAIAALEPFGIVEVWRRGQGQDWTRALQTFFLDEEREYVERETFTATCIGVLARLAWRIVGYYAGTADHNSFSYRYASEIMRRLVYANAGPGATTAALGRLADSAGLDVDPDELMHGTLLSSWSCAWANLYDELLKLQPYAGGDFDLVEVSPSFWRWEFYPGQRGEDRSASVVFALERGNVANAQMSITRSANRATRVFVAGPGEGSERYVVIRDSGQTLQERFLDQRQVTSGLEEIGDAALDAARVAAEPRITYQVLQTEACRYGLHYEVGDLVSYQLFGLRGVHQVCAVTVSVQPGRAEQIDAELRAVATPPWNEGT